MASATQRTTHIRKRKLTGKGAVRKARNRTKGTTLPAAVLFGDEAPAVTTK
jgi:hypothetical protein